MKKSVHAIFIKYPEAGNVKTRLGKSIGMEKAAEIYKELAERVVVNCESDGYDTIIFIDDMSKTGQMDEWLGKGHTYMPQKGHDLGEKLENAFRDVFALGYERCSLSGSDICCLTKDIIAQSLDCLSHTDCAIGSATDGGYYLISFSASSFEPVVFHEMIWSTENVLNDTLKKLMKTTTTFKILKELPDIDTEEDLKYLQRGVF